MIPMSIFRAIRGPATRGYGPGCKDYTSDSDWAMLAALGFCALLLVALFTWMYFDVQRMRAEQEAAWAAWQTECTAINGHPERRDNGRKYKGRTQYSTACVDAQGAILHW